jgi:hypothetical protein
VEARSRPLKVECWVRSGLEPGCVPAFQIPDPDPCVGEELLVLQQRSNQVDVQCAGSKRVLDVEFSAAQ